MIFLAYVKHPGSQEDMISNWQLAQSLAEDVVPGAEITATPCLLPMAVAHLPPCLWGKKVLIALLDVH